MTFRASTVIKAIGETRLKLVAGKGYWYFVFDDEKNKLFDTHSVYVMRLSQLPLQEWIDEGKEFVAKMKRRIKEKK